MEFKETGFLLRTENYEECVEFYSRILELPVRLQKDGLTNFQFGNAYLLIERAWEPSPKEIREREAPTFMLRMNVEDVAGAVSKVRAKGVTVELLDFDWGEVGKFRDPGGNMFEFCRWK